MASSTAVRAAQVALATTLFTLNACTGDTPHEPGQISGQSIPINLAVEVGGMQIAGLSVVVTGPGIANPPPAGNLTVGTGGIANGTVRVPAGSDRVFTVNAFDAKGINTHTGTRTADVRPGVNMLVHVTLLPLAGGAPIEVTFGTYTVTISPAVHDMSVGSAVQYVATVTGLNNMPIENPVLQWASLNPGVAAVDGEGLTEGLYGGETTIIVSYEGIAAASALRVAAPILKKLGFTNSFTADAEGWTLVNAASSQPTHHAAGGNPDGYIGASAAGANAAWYWRAPADFHGDLSRYSLPTLEFDLIQPGSGVSIPGDDVILEGSSLTLVRSIEPPSTTWTSYAISLTDPTGWVNRATGLPASRLQLIAAMANATNLQIRGRYHEGALTGGLDNPGIPFGKKTVP